MAFDRDRRKGSSVRGRDRRDLTDTSGSVTTLGSRTVLIPNLPSGDDHPRFKNIVIGRHHDVYFDIGSTSNASPSPRSNPPYATVMEYAPSGRRIRVWARGIRNGDGLSFAPDGSLWTAINERDDVAFPFPQGLRRLSDAYGQVIQIVNNHPPDEIAKLTAGRNVGWPFCNPDPDLDPGAAEHRIQIRRVDVRLRRADQPRRPRAELQEAGEGGVGLPAHSAPLGFHFLQEEQAGETVALRSRRRRPRVMGSTAAACTRGPVDALACPSATRWRQPGA